MIYEFKEQDAYDFARRVGARTKKHGDELQFTDFCPYCKGGGSNDKDTFSINLKTGQFKCLRNSCGVTGNMITLSRDFDFSLGYEADEYYQPRKKFKKLKTPTKPILPKPRAIEYLASRGISEETAKKFEITVHAKQPNVLVFPFYDEKGKLQFVKYRDMDFFVGKTYTTASGEVKKAPKEWNEADCKPILFGMKQCDVKLGRIIITEGMMDALSVAESGIDNASSVHGGSLNFRWVPYCWNWLTQFDEIIVFGDFEKGHMTLLEDIQRRFPNKIKHVREEDYKDCKDANEILVKYGKEAVRQAVENAEYVPIDRVIELADVEDVDIYKLEKLSSTIDAVDKLLYGGIPFGGVCLVTGKPGEGKSTLASQILVSAINSGYKIFAYSGELPNYQFKAWMDFQIAGPHHITENISKAGNLYRFITNPNKKLIAEWYRGKAFMYDNRIIEEDEQDDLIKTVSNAIMQYGIRVVLIDNLMTALDLDCDKFSDRYEKQSQFMKKLARIALKFDVLILLVAHKRKNNFSTNENDEVSGSGDIANLATLTLSYGKDKDIAESQRKLRVTKNRLFGKVNTYGYTLDFDEKSKRIYGIDDDKNVQYGWDKSDGFTDVDQMEIPFE